MKVLDLQCAMHHSFEGWFSSEADFQTQLSARQIECPLCGDASIIKCLSAPRLNLSRPSPPEESETPAEPSEQATDAPPDAATLQSAWVKITRHLMENTEDVGDRFADEVRKMHYGEAPERSVRGHATPKETAELLEEGIEVMQLPVPKMLKGPLQ